MLTIDNPALNARVLVVENERLIAEELYERLSRMGFEVVGNVDTAEAAIRMANRERPDLVLMDIRLKGNMDGIEAAGKIRHELEIPVVFLTAHSDRLTRARAMESSPYAYVLKPFREEDLLVAMETALHLNVQERRLKESETRYSATLASIVDGVIATNEDGRVTFMNPVAEELTGWSFQEAQGAEIEEVLRFFDEASKNFLDSPARGVLQQRSPMLLREARLLLIRRDGGSIPVDANAAPITTTAGVIGAVVAFRDLSARRLTEDALRQAEEQIRRAQKLDAIGQLAGGVAHDFNNLLTIINGCANLALEKKELDAATKDLLKDIEEAGERAAALTGQLLAFSRKQVLAPVLLDLNAVLKAMEGMFRRILREDIGLTLILRKSISHVRADRSQFEQVIMNLVVNAREAMTSGGQLTIETSNVYIGDADISKYPDIKAGPYVMLAVTDTGLGMSAATQSHIFEPFFTTKGTRKGTGLGLATVHGIVSQSGGGVYVESDPGRGTTFSIYLPLVAHGPGEPAASEVREESETPQLGCETILVVEDEDGVRSVLLSMLRRFGYKVLAARSGKEAISIFERGGEPIHLLVTDVVMPEMGGRELGDSVRAIKPGIPILFLSGYIDDEVLRDDLLESGISFLQKPAAAHVLALRVRQILDKSSYDETDGHSRTGAGDTA